MSGWLRATLLLLLIGLTTSRIGLVLHELLGHYGVARAFGCRLRALRLFWFGGGYVDYACGVLAPAQQLATELGGIALEIALGALLWALARRRREGLSGLALACMGLLFVLHALFYLVTGVHYGVGDGRDLAVLLGQSRPPFVAAGSLALLALSFHFARRLAPRLSGWLPSGGTPRRVAALGAAIAAAAAAHGVLTLAEQALRADATYAAVFRPQHERRIEQSLQRFEAERPRAPQEVAARRRALEARLRVFPLRPVLGAAIALGALAGLAAALRRAGPALDAQAARLRLAPAALGCALALALVLALDRLL